MDIYIAVSMVKKWANRLYNNTK